MKERKIFVCLHFSREETELNIILVALLTKLKVDYTKQDPIFQYDKKQQLFWYLNIFLDSNSSKAIK